MALHYTLAHKYFHTMSDNGMEWLDALMEAATQATPATQALPATPATSATPARSELVWPPVVPSIPGYTAYGNKYQSTSVVVWGQTHMVLLQKN